ncbi:MAG: hypothetical protein ACL93V_09940 [Candidatus Electrothrix sp. YB6]
MAGQLPDLVRGYTEPFSKDWLRDKEKREIYTKEYCSLKQQRKGGEHSGERTEKTEKTKYARRVQGVI